MAATAPLKYRVYEPWRAPRQEEYVLRALRANDLTYRGATVRRFEEAVAARVGAKYCLATCNGTGALYTAYRAAFGAAKSKLWDYVAVSPLTYAATASQLLLQGFSPFYVDCDASFQLDAEALEQALRAYPDRFRGVVVPSVYADAPDMTDVLAVAKRYGVPVVEDAAEAFGCVQQGKFVGTIGAAGVFSFFANKVVTTGEGGALVTDDEGLYRDAVDFANHRTGRDYEHHGPGCNFRMPALSAAVGLAQLEAMDDVIARKQRIAAFYRRVVQAEAVVPARVEASSEWMPVFVLPERLAYTAFREVCEAGGVETRPTFKPLHRMRGFAPLGHLSACPVADSLRGFILPCHPGLTGGDLEYIAAAANAALGATHDGEQLRDDGDRGPLLRGGVVCGLRP